ncbi:MAG: alpha/beta hydrolase [Staphylococcus equorum]
MKQYFNYITCNHHKIIIKLPKDYYKQPTKYYPAVFVQDGDYLFKSINADVIFFGIKPVNRTKEYTPWEVKLGDQINAGGADEYLKWLTQKLIPYLKKCYRISSKKDDFAIGGASYGALLSLYALYTVPDYFAKYIIISPSVWYPHFLEYMKNQHTINTSKHIFWYVGGQEGKKHTRTIKNMVPNSILGSQILKETLSNTDSTLKFVINKKGIHRQSFFNKYFKKAIEVLY